MNRRVVVTGIGLITPLGTGNEETWASLKAKRSLVQQVDYLDPSEFKSRIAAMIPAFDPLDFMAPKRARRLDRFSQLSVASSRIAVEQACLLSTDVGGDQVGVNLGSALGGVAYGEAQHLKYFEGGLKAVDPMIALSVFGGAGSTNAAIEFGFTGPSMGNANSCASGSNAIGEAFRMIKRGEIDVMLAGGVEAPLAPMTFGAFAMIRALSTRNDDPESASRPFDAARDGFVLGEGAAMLVLEEFEHAVNRGQEPLAEVLGYGATNDAYNMIAPRPDGSQAARSMTLAIAEAGVAPDEIDYINTHSTSTPLGDTAESLAINAALGPAGRTIPVSGTKGYYAHSLGASGAIEAALMPLILRNGWLPPTVNLDNPDPKAELALIQGDGIERQVETVVSNAFGFGGINTCLVFRRV
jgi:3-oxoacyl-[acyl-carrier-protein] synthase II